ncbi:DUF6481 family protein [Methylobacterium oryzisoli]
MSAFKEVQFSDRLKSATEVRKAMLVRLQEWPTVG